MERIIAFRQLIAANIKKGRQRMGSSQYKLAESCDLSPSYLAELEGGKKFPSIPTLLSISESLELQPYQLFLKEEKEVIFDKYSLTVSLINKIKLTINKNLNEIKETYLSHPDL